VLEKKLVIHKARQEWSNSNKTVRELYHLLGEKRSVSSVVFFFSFISIQHQYHSMALWNPHTMCNDRWNAHTSKHPYAHTLFVLCVYTFYIDMWSYKSNVSVRVHSYFPTTLIHFFYNSLFQAIFSRERERKTTSSL
jgi:hypothetical protein